jgi:hypothetical protein
MPAAKPAPGKTLLTPSDHTLIKKLQLHPRQGCPLDVGSKSSVAGEKGT